MGKAAKIGVLLIVPLGLWFTPGCGSKSKPGGEPGTRSEFVLHGPVSEASLKPGDTQTVTITIDRGKEFKEAVNLKAESPKGIEANLTPTTVQPNDKGEVQLKITATKDSPVGENAVHVIGIPEKGQPTSLDVKVKVNPAQESFTLKAPLLAPSVRQGDAQTVTVSVNRPADFKKTIKFTAQAPSGLQVEVMPAELAPSDKGEVNLRVHAQPTAALDENVVHLTGTPAEGQPVFIDVKINVRAAK